jgi:hypothetical protein
LRNLRLTLGTTSVFLGILLQIYSLCFLLPSIAPVNSNGHSIHQISTASFVLVLINSRPVIGQSVRSRPQPFSKWRDSDKDHRYTVNIYSPRCQSSPYSTLHSRTDSSSTYTEVLRQSSICLRNGSWLRWLYLQALYSGWLLYQQHPHSAPARMSYEPSHLHDPRRCPPKERCRPVLHITQIL